jgi:hypothetical protein
MVRNMIHSILISICSRYESNRCGGCFVCRNNPSKQVLKALSGFTYASEIDPSGSILKTASNGPVLSAPTYEAHSRMKTPMRSLARLIKVRKKAGALPC